MRYRRNSAMEKTIGLDHAYSRHWSESYKTDTSHAKPIQWILHSCSGNPHAKTSRLRSQHITFPANAHSSSDGSEDEIDVESLDEVMSPYVPGRSYDVQKARLHMNETEKFTIQSLMSEKAAHTMRSDTDWEEYINKSSWDMPQTKLFSKVVNVLMDEKLARLVFKGVNNEPIARRLSLDRSAACLRRIFAEFAWDQKLTHWLHSLLICHLPAGMLASYLDLIQTLRSKVPSLVERMIMQYASDSTSTSPDTLNIILKRPWEPTLMKYPLLSKEKLYDPPIIILIPNSPYASSPTMAHRKRFWNSHLSQLGKVVYVVSPEKTQAMTILSYIEQLATAARLKISFYKKKYPRRSVILAGWHNASVLSCHISLVEKVDAIICLGFPAQTLNGPRGTVDDVFCDMTAPTLFIVGEEADSCDIDKIEDFREQFLTRCENHLLAIPGADDALRVSDRIKRKACVTQHMVDRMILDQIANFLSNTLIMNIGKWHLSESVMDTDTSSKSQSKIKGQRKRQNSDEIELAMMKRRRLASVTTAKISEILSGQSSSKGRDGARTPVQGVAYNLQTGSISGLVTVPHALSRALSKTNEPVQALKGKGTGRNKNQTRSITIDLTKDTAPQIKRGQSYGISPDPALLATGSQTEAAVAAILGGDFASSEDRVHSPTPRSENKTVTASTENSDIATAASSAFTRVSSAMSSSLPSSEVPATSTTASTYDAVSQYQKPKPAFANVKFQSTVTQKQASQRDTSSALLTINKQHWSGILDSSVSAAVTKTDFPRKYPYLPPPAADNTSHITSRSRTEERETMQATAILEQLTSGIGNDTEQNNQPVSSQAGVASYRRHTYDSNFLMEGAGRGRGRVRTRGRTTQSALARDGIQRRRKTFQEERPPPVTSYYQQKQKPKQGSFVRYIMGRDASSGIRDASSGISVAATKAPKTMAVPVVTSRIEPAKSAQKPSVLPVYTFQQTPPTTSIKIQSLASPVTTIKPGSITSVSKLTTGVPPSFQTTALKKPPSKVILGQRMPVKFPGAAPGSSYTFVTIPALTGPPLLAAGQRGTLLRKVTPNPTKIKKYSVVPRSNITVLSSPSTGAMRPISAISTSAVPVPVSLVALRGKAMPKLPIASIPRPVESSAKPVAKTASSVVIHKLCTEAASDVGEGSGKDAKPMN